MSGEKNELRITLTKKCADHRSCTCLKTPNNLDIKVSKKKDKEIHGVKGFIGYIHELTNGETFTLKQYLSPSDTLQKELDKVTKVTVYYWTNAQNDPLFLEAETISGPQYYYRYRAEEIPGQDPNIWTYDENTGTSLIERLDDRNCGINGAIVFDLKTPTQSPTSKKSSCASKKRKITVPSQKHTSIIGEYTVNRYKVEGTQTTISRVTYGAKNTTINPPNEPVTHIRVYYWTNKPGIPLLIEFVKKSKGSEWFENTHKTSLKWKSVTDNTTNFYDNTGGQLKPKQALTTKLDEVNCNVNDVVKIDVSEKPDGDSLNKEYCHATHKGKKRIRVQEVSGSYAQLTNYKAYAHIPNKEAYSDEEIKEESSTHKFNISAFKNDGTPISLGTSLTPPVMNAEKVIVFICEKGSDKTPLLIYIDAPTLKEQPDGNKQWFQSLDQGVSWNAVESKAPKTETSYSEILDILDKLTSDCAPPKVIIKIDVRDHTKPTHSYQDTSVPPRTINVTKDDQPSNAPGFTEYTHKVVGRQNSYFTLNQVNHENTQAQTFNTPTPKVSSVSVYYWTALEKANKSESRPLLVKVTLHGGTEKWYENKSQNTNNDNWHKINDPSHVTGNNLLNKLTLLNCKLNGVTVIDIGKKRGDTYCHEPNPTIGEGSHSKLIQVTDITKNPPYNNNIGRFVVYSHTLSEEASKKSHLGNKFHISGFKNTNKNQASITLTESPPPLLNVTKFLVFWCGSGPKAEPLLFYLEYGTQQKEWFKKPPRETEPWIKLEEGKKPSDENDTKAIWDILNSYDTECKFKWWHIITGTAGGGATGGVGYWAYKGFEWFFMAPWPRLM